MKTNALAITALSMLAVGTLSSCSKSDSKSGSAPVPEIAIVTVAPGSVEFQSNFPATIKGKTDIDIRPQISGFITKVNVDEGQKVHKGQVLFTIDQVQFQAAVDQAQANLNSARSAVNTAEITEANKRKLLDKNIISETEWQLAANQLAQARAAAVQAEAALTNAQKNLAYTLVTAPSDGVVGSIPNREGSLASPSSALTTLSDNSQVYAYFSINEKDLLELTNGGTTSVEESMKEMPEVELKLADGSIYPIKGRIATVSGVIDKTTGAASARALFDNPAGMLRSGNTARVIMPHMNEDVIIIPQRATYEVQDLRYVYVLNDSNIANSVQITIDPYNDGKSFVVRTGLNAGDRVVTEGVGTKVRQGTKINPVE